MAADKPAEPGAERVTERAGSAGAAKAAHGDKLRTRERQSTFVAGSLAMRIEEKTPGRIHCIKVSTTRYKTVTTIVFDRKRNKRVRAPIECRPSDAAVRRWLVSHVGHPACANRMRRKGGIRASRCAARLLLLIDTKRFKLQPSTAVFSCRLYRLASYELRIVVERGA